MDRKISKTLILLGLFLIGFSIGGLCQIAFGQIVVPDLSPPHTLIQVEAVAPTVPVGCKVYYEWKFDHGVSTYQIGAGRKLVLAATPGTHRADLRVVCIDYDKKKYEPSDYTAQFTIGNAPPTPVPPPDPDTSLCGLVTSEQAIGLVANYSAQSRVIASGAGTHTAIFRSASTKRLEQEGLSETGAATAIAARIDEAIGTENVELSDSLRTKLVACLDGIVKDLNCTNPDPLPEQGARVVVIVRETNDTTTDRSLLYLNLRDGPAADYIAGQNHSLMLLDDDSLDETKAPAKVLEALRPQFVKAGLPALLILDESTREVLYAAKLKEEMTADNVIEILRQNGG